MSQSIRDYFESIIDQTSPKMDGMDAMSRAVEYEQCLMRIRQAARSAIQQMDKPPRRPQQQTALDLD